MRGGRNEEEDYRGEGREKEMVEEGVLSALGETGKSGLGRVAGQVREWVERGLRETEGGQKGK